MADRSSASLFATIFNLLAENPTDDHKNMAAKIWPKVYAYDFDYYQMGCDEALLKLDLAEEKPSEDPDEVDDDGKPIMLMFYGLPGEREQ